MFVALGNEDRSTPKTVIATSVDGINWQEERTPSSTQLADVTFGREQFVAVGGRGLILISPDAAEWTARSSGTEEDLAAVAYGRETFVALGRSSKILTSPDGKVWTPRPSAFNRCQQFHGIAYGGNMFVAVGGPVPSFCRTGPNPLPIVSLMISQDGINWATQVTDLALFGVTYANHTFVAVGEGVILTSRDGVTWKEHSTNFGPPLLSAVVGGASSFVAVGETGLIVQSPFAAHLSHPVPRADGAIEVLLHGPVGGHWRLEATTDFLTWTSLSTNTSASGTITFSDNSSGNIRQRFYRAVAQ